MSFPNVIFGYYGDEKVTNSAKIGSLPLGVLMILPDGRQFRLARAGSAASLGAGVIVSTSASQVGHGGISGSGLTASATTTYNAVSATTIRLLAKTTAFTKDQYADGYLSVVGPAASTYIGHVYKIKSNKSCGSVGELELALDDNDGLKVAFAASSTVCALRKSPYDDAIVHNQGTIIAPPMGVAPVAVSISHYFWVQRGGPAAVVQGASVVVNGAPIVTASAEAGSASVPPTTADTSTVVAAYNLEIRATKLGHALAAAAASQGVLVDLTLE